MEALDPLDGRRALGVEGEARLIVGGNGKFNVSGLGSSSAAKEAVKDYETAMRLLWDLSRKQGAAAAGEHVTESDAVTRFRLHRAYMKKACRIIPRKPLVLWS